MEPSIAHSTELITMPGEELGAHKLFLRVPFQRSVLIWGSMPGIYFVMCFVLLMKTVNKKQHKVHRAHRMNNCIKRKCVKGVFLCAH